MTLGDLFAYIFFTGLLAMPIVQIASIGTQITEAFAGLDRIHEILDTPREDADDASRDAARRDLRGDIEFEDVWFEYNPGVPVLKDVSFRAPAGTTTALVGIVGIGQEHAHQPGDGVQPADAGRRARRRPRSAEPAARPTTAATSASCCRTTSCSTARSPRTSRTARRTRRARTSSA